MKLGANHPMGPLALADLVGLDICLSVMEVLNNEFADSKYRPCPLLKKMVSAGYLGRKSGLALYATKTGINAALEAMSPASGSWSDADSLVVALGDPESRRLSAEYLERVRK